MLSNLYGSTKGIERRMLWQELVSVKAQVGTFPWLIAGDFNVVRCQQEKWGTYGISGYEIDFVNFIQSLEIEDLASTGFFHTWSNKQAGENFISKKLDRVMANFGWIKAFVNTSVDFFEGGLSDHSPALVSIEDYISYGPKPFKFFNFWADHGQFLDWIQEGWNSEVDGYSMFELYSKLKGVKQILKAKNKEFFNGLGQRVVLARKALAMAQEVFIASHGSLNCYLKEKECLHEFISISLA
jgi:hypothetical protein